MKKNLLALLLLVLASLYFNYHRTMDLYPNGHHYYRQSDSGAQVINYMKNGLNFFDFGTLSVTSNSHTESKSVSEFPILYYFAAVLNTIFGYNYFTIRVLHFLILFIGLFYLFKTINLITKNFILSLFTTLFTFSIVPVAFYGNTAIPDIPGLGFFFIGFYLFIKYRHNKKLKYLYFSLFFLSFASLLKITFYYGIASVYLYILFVKFNIYFKKKEIEIPYKTLLLSLVFVLVPLMWSVTAFLYNKHVETGLFLVSVLPIWGNNNIVELFLGIFNERISRVIFYISGIVFVVSLSLIFAFYRKFNKEFLFFFIIFLFSSIAYLLLWYSQFYHHNYYFIEMAPLLAVVFTGGALLLLKINNNYIYISVVSLLGILLAYNIYFTHLDISRKYFFNNYDTWRVDVVYNDFSTIQPYMKSIGVYEDDRIIVGFDFTPNFSLFLMQQYGWTQKALQWFTTDQLKEKGAKYVITNVVQDNSNVNIEQLNLVGIWNRLKIYSFESNASICYPTGCSFLSYRNVDKFTSRIYEGDTVKRNTYKSDLLKMSNLKVGKEYLLVTEIVKGEDLVFGIKDDDEYSKTCKYTFNIGGKLFNYTPFVLTSKYDELYYYVMNKNKEVVLANVYLYEY